MTTNKHHVDYRTLLANVSMNDHDRRNAERDLRRAERLVDALVAIAGGARKVMHGIRSGFATAARAPQ